MHANTPALDCIVVEPVGETVDASIIWMHGLGADGNDFVGIVDQLGLPINHKIRFIFPHAPYRKITINSGMTMRGWYDLFSMNLNFKEDILGIQESHQQVSALVQAEIDRGVAAKRIILAGFSQGGAIALYTGLRLNCSLAGIIALSTYQLLADRLATEGATASKSTPIFIAHGMFDPVVPFHLGQQAHQQLIDLDYKVQWNAYPMQHTLLPEEIQHIGDFINQALDH